MAFLAQLGLIFSLALSSFLGLFNHSQTPISTIATSSSAYIIYTEPMYVNQKYGFEIGMPATWTKYAVNISNQTSWPVGTIVMFALPLDSDVISQYLDGPEKSANVLNVDWIEIFPIAYYDAHKNDCDGADWPCFFPSEITRNSQYVFAWGAPSPNVGWDPCSVPGAIQAEPYVCKVIRNDYIPKTDTYFDSQNFKLLSQ